MHVMDHESNNIGHPEPGPRIAMAGDADVPVQPIEQPKPKPSDSSPGGVRRLPRPSNPGGYQGGFPGNPR